MECQSDGCSNPANFHVNDLATMQTLHCCSIHAQDYLTPPDATSDTTADASGESSSALDWLNERRATEREQRRNLLNAIGMVIIMGASAGIAAGICYGVRGETWLVAFEHFIGGLVGAIAGTVLGSMVFFRSALDWARKVGDVTAIGNPKSFAFKIILLAAIIGAAYGATLGIQLNADFNWIVFAVSCVAAAGVAVSIFASRR